MALYTQSLPLCNLQASRNPTVTDDASCGFSVGSLWGRENRIYKCSDSTNGAAIWDLQGGGGSEVTDSVKRTALKLVTNWFNPDDAGDLLYYKMTLNLPTGQSEHDYYIGIDTATNTAFRYTYEKIDGTLAWVRMPLQISISGL